MQKPVLLGAFIFFYTLLLSEIVCCPVEIPAKLPRGLVLALLDTML